jgi:dipeptide/tripeptide permease
MRNEVTSDSDSNKSKNSVDDIQETYMTWKTFHNSPRQLWVILICKFFESLSFITEDFIFFLFFQNEFGMDQFECGIVYSLAAIMTFIYGLLFGGYIIDCGMGVKPCMLLGSLLLAIARFLPVILTSKNEVYIVMATIVPFGMSLCKAFNLVYSQ